MERSNLGKFEDFVLEANKGSDFRVFDEKVEAEEWLLKGYNDKKGVFQN
jgi:hypothetical protein